ncbi:MAG: hypothetical protein R3A80_13410 [Bdellovibrionota bacterium]
MNLAHLHLILNHIPIVGIPIALAFLIQGIWAKNKSTQKFSLIVLFVLALIVLPVFYTGEPAEEVIEHLPGVTEAFIHPHEEAAELSLILTLITGALAFLALFFQKDEKKARILNFGVIGVATIATASLIYTANLGGQIRHTEFRSSSIGETESSTMDTLEHEDDD